MSTQVTMPDGTASDLADHLRDRHRKGTRGFTEEYLATLHDILHQRERERERDPVPEHAHPDAETVEMAAITDADPA